MVSARELSLVPAGNFKSKLGNSGGETQVEALFEGTKAQEERLETSFGPALFQSCFILQAEAEYVKKYVSFIE